MTIARTAVDHALLFVALIGGSLLTWLALVEAPSFEGRAGFTAPLSWKLFFFHVPIAFTGFAAFGVALVHSVLYLVRSDEARDQRAQAAVETGLLFSGLTLATGMVWGEAEWGTPWRWSDVKLVLVLLMFLLYLAYLLLRRELSDPDQRGRVSAVYALTAFITIPLAWFAQRIWLSYHPVVFGSDDPTGGLSTPGVLPVFLLGLVVFVAAFLFLYRWRVDLLAFGTDLDRQETAEVVR